MFWPLFTDDHPSWRFNILVPVVFAIQLVVKGAIIKDRDDPDVRAMSRTGEPSELLYGPLHFCLVMNVLGIMSFRTQESLLSMSCLGFGDGIAPLVGTTFPFGRIPTYPFGADDKKTLSGTVAFFVASICGYYLMQFAVPGENVSLNSLAQVAAIGAATEAITGKYDNLLVCTATYFYAKYIL